MDEAFLRIIDEKSSLLDGLADYIWDHPETAFTEYASAARYCEVLRAEAVKWEMRHPNRTPRVALQFLASLQK